MLEFFSTLYNNVLAPIGAIVVAGGGMAAIAFAMFRFLGDKWLGSKFEKQLAAYKHAQQRELEELKFKINSLMDRTVKLHQKEFDVIPELWSKLTDAFYNAEAHLGYFQQHPDLERMKADALKEFIEKTPFDQWQKQEILEAHHKNDKYFSAISWYNHTKARTLCIEYFLYLSKNGIFVPEELKEMFHKVGDVVHSALVEYEM